MVVPGLEISATTVMRNVRKNEWDIEIEERKEEDKIKAKYIYIQVDEDHIKERNKKGCTISKIVTIYTRKRTLTKPDRIDEVKQEIKEDEQLGRNTKRLKNRLKKIENTKTYLMNQWSGIEAHDKYKDKLTGCCQEGQVHHTLSERMSTDAKVWCENGIDEMSQLRAFT